MSTPQISQRWYSGDDDSSNHTTLIIVIVVILVLKICLIVTVCYFRNKKKRQRAARGCTCFNDTDYYCLPWWYWNNDSRCHCGAMNRTIYNAPPQYNSGTGFGYAQGPGYVPDSVYPPAQYAMGPQTEAGKAYGQQQSAPVKPADQVYVGGRYHFNDGDY